MNPWRRLMLAIAATCGLGCSEPSTAPARATVSPPIDRLFVFGRSWPTDHVELILTRRAGQGTLVLFRPPGDGEPLQRALRQPYHAPAAEPGAATHVVHYGNAQDPERVMSTHW